MRELNDRAKRAFSDARGAASEGDQDLLVSGFVGDWGRSWSGSMVYIVLTYVRQNEPKSGPKNGNLMLTRE